MMKVKSPVLFDHRLTVDETVHRSKEHYDAKNVQQENRARPAKEDLVLPVELWTDSSFRGARRGNRGMSFHVSAGGGL